MKENRYISFDWAMKHLLRNKADHSVLEESLASIFNRPIKLIKFFESEGNQNQADNRYNRIDILAESADREKKYCLAFITISKQEILILFAKIAKF